MSMNKPALIGSMDVAKIARVDKIQTTVGSIYPKKGDRIQEAIDDLGSEAGFVILPAHSYTCTGSSPTLEMNKGDYQGIISLGGMATLNHDETGTDKIFLELGDGTNQRRFCLLQNLHIYNAKLYNGRKGILADGMRDLLIRNCWIERYNDLNAVGLHVRNSTAAFIDFVRIVLCRIQANNAILFEANVNGITNSLIQGGSFVRGGALQANCYGIKDVGCNTLRIENNPNIENFDLGVWLNGAAHNSIISGRFENQDTADIQIDAGVSYCKVLKQCTPRGLTITDNGTYTDIKGIVAFAWGVGITPVAAELNFGHIAHNTSDDTLWVKCPDGVVRQLA